MNTALVGKQFLDELATGLSTLVTRGLTQLLGPAADTRIIGSLTWAEVGAAVCFGLAVLLAHAAVAGFMRRRFRKAEAHPPERKELHRHVLGALRKPVYLMIWVFGIYLMVTPLLGALPSGDARDSVRHGLDILFGIGVFMVLLWLFSRFTTVIERRLELWASRTESKVDDLVVPLVSRALRVFLPVVAVIFALPALGLSAAYASLIARGGSILIIGAVAWVLFQCVRLGEQVVLAKFDIKAADNLRARKVYTQVHVISKTLYFIIVLFTVASILMLFEEVRRFGTSLLASAGVVGVIAGFAAQRTIANLFAGFQLALTQPIRVDDVVIVENEWGRIEEITLTYVIVHIWDDRRLVVPLNYFIEHPFQNWTRSSSQLLGAVELWVDYTLPVGEVRQAVKAMVEPHPLWDRRFWNLQVTDASERAMQIRVLVTAADSSKAWDLRCDLREKLIAYLQNNHPGSLPQVRAQIAGTNAGSPPDPSAP